jgi:5-formyltetrahydrofolate cyclo-ligase
MAPHPSSDLIDEKHTLRRTMGDRRSALSAADRASLSAAAAERVLGLPELEAATRAPGGGVVAGYVSFRGEIDPAPILEAARARGATVALPRVGTGAPRLSFHLVDVGVPLRAGPWGLLEPDAAAPEVGAPRIDLMIVPGLAFDARGYRLGYGKGHYDEVVRPLRAAGHGVLVGLAYDFQVVDRCPAGPGDETVDVLVTDRRVLRAPALGRGGRS